MKRAGRSRSRSPGYIGGMQQDDYEAQRAERIRLEREKRVARMALVVGSRVRYARDFLRDTSQHTGSLPFANGTVTGFTDWGLYRLVHIDWDDTRSALPPSVAEPNLSLAEHPSRPGHPPLRETEATEWSPARRL